MTGGADDALRTAVLGLLGLARRAGALRLGARPVLRALREEGDGIVFLAHDAGQDLADRMELAAKGAQLERALFSAADLADAFGRDRLSVVSVHESGFVRGIRRRLSDTR